MAEVHTQIMQLFTKIIEENLSKESFEWLKQKGNHSAVDNYQLNIGFTSIPRKVGKKDVLIQNESASEIAAIIPGFSIQHWSMHTLCRVWLLLHSDKSDKETYCKRIEYLFSLAEMNELVALYASLPLLEYPEAWKLRCAEGIRSNIGTVLEAILYQNPYPANYLEDPAWNQLIMKAFFTEKKIHYITGLDKRRNKELANILFDYVEERWAAGRPANPMIWRLTGKFMDESHFYMMETLFSQSDEMGKKSAALACHDSKLESAQQLLSQFPELKLQIEKGILTWDQFSIQLEGEN